VAKCRRDNSQFIKEMKTMMELPDGYVWVQKDAMKVRCKRCGETTTADVIDLHMLTCEGGNDE